MDPTPSTSGRSPVPDGMQEPAPRARLEAGDALPGHDVDRLLAWFVRVRWLFLAGLGAAIVVGSAVLRADFRVLEVVGVGVFILAYNTGLLLHRRTRRSAPTTSALQLEAGLQIGLDLLALTVLVHLTGGASSPFVILYVIHAIAGSMLLPRHLAWAVGGVAFLLLVVVTVLEYEPFLRPLRPGSLDELGWLGHRSLRVAIAITFLVAIATATTITSSIMNSLRLVDARLLEKQTQLVKAEKQASLGRLVAGVAHEINNPVQFIRGNMAVLTEAFDDLLPILDRYHATEPDLRLARLDYPFFRAQLPVLLQDMGDGADRIASIVSDLKTYAHPDEGRLDEDVDLCETVRSSVRLLHNHLKHFLVELEVPPYPASVRGNATQLQQLVVNLLQNAYQALGDDPAGRIGVGLRREPGGGSWLLSVQDTGCGIPASVRSRMFDPFFTTKRRSEGTGLGLAIAQEIVERHRGRIEVESQVGAGATFQVHLPVRRGGAT